MPSPSVEEVAVIVLNNFVHLINRESETDPVVISIKLATRLLERFEMKEK